MTKTIAALPLPEVAELPVTTVDYAPLRQFRLPANVAHYALTGCVGNITPVELALYNEMREKQGLGVASHVVSSHTNLVGYQTALVSFLPRDAND